LDAARALALLKSQPGTGRREVEQLRRQAALVADLGEVPLQEVLRHAAETAPDEWRLVFPHRYQGKAVLFDAQVSRDAAGKFQLEHFLFLGDETARVAVGDLDLFRHLRLDRPCRLIVGARLAGVGREPSGGWVIRLEPGSGVLMTDRDVVTTACPFLRDDPELPEVLGRQQSWLADVP
jgi:hypothetical protein